MTSDIPHIDCSVPLDLNNLLHQIGTEVASKWYQLGIAVGISEEMLDECSNRTPEEAVVEVLDYWIRNHKPSWEDVAETLNEVGLANSVTVCQGKKVVRHRTYTILNRPAWLQFPCSCMDVVLLL